MTRQIFTILILLFLAAEALAYSSKDCSGYNQPGYQDEYRTCLRMELATRAGESGVDCVECLFAQEEKKPADWVLALSAIAQPLAYLGSAYITSKYQYKSQQAWADAYSSAYTQCTNRFNSYLDYTTTMGANPISSTDAQSLMSTCNGNGYSAYSGYGGLVGNGYGGYTNPMLASGYSSGFLGGMVGPNYGAMSGGGFGVGLGLGLYSGLSNGLYGGAGYGLYGNMGMGTSPYGYSYSSPYSGYYGAGMTSAGMGINPYGSYSGYAYGGAPYAAGNLSASFGLSLGGSAGFAF